MGSNWVSSFHTVVWQLTPVWKHILQLADAREDMNLDKIEVLSSCGSYLFEFPCFTFFILVGLVKRMTEYLAPEKFGSLISGSCLLDKHVLNFHLAFTRDG